MSARPKDQSRSKRTPKYDVRACELCSDAYTPTSARQRWCEPCVPTRQWMHRARKYGVGKREWEKLLAKQGGTCALCPAPPEVVDHDHETRKTRGLLCVRCNVMLGVLETDPSWRKRATMYVSRKT